jgi:hypothetical protein
VRVHPVIATRTLEPPAVLFDQFDRVSDLH